MLGRLLVTLGALLLAGTAAWHASGGTQVAGWLSGGRGAVLQTLWFMPVIDWAAVAAAWLLIAWRGGSAGALLIWVLALIPAGAAATIGSTVGPTYLTMWLLAGAALLAALGAIALPRRPAN